MISIFNVLCFIQFLYLALATVTLILSSSCNRQFFNYQVVGYLIKKLIDLFFLNDHLSKSFKNIFCNIIGFQRQPSSQNNEPHISISIIIFVYFEDVLIWNLVLSANNENDSHNFQQTNEFIQNSNILLENDDLHKVIRYYNLNYYLQLIQLLLGLLLKSIIMLFILLPYEQKNIEKQNIKQLSSLFFWACSLQGLFCFLYICCPQVLWILITVKVVSVLMNTIIAFIKKLDFFGCLPEGYFTISLVGGIFQIFNMPVDYAPFYYNSWKNDEQLVDLATQKSISVFKAFQTIELLVLIFLNIEVLLNLAEQYYLNHSREQSIFLFKIYLLLFFLISGIVTAIITTNHLIFVASQSFTHNYRFLKKELLQIEEVIQILERSDCLTYFEVSSVQNKLLLENDLSLQKRFFAGLIKQVPNIIEESPCIIIDDIAEISSNTFNHLKIDQMNLLASGFLERLSDLNYPIPKCIINNNEEKYKLQFLNCLIVRIFYEGITQRVKDVILINIQGGLFQNFTKLKSILTSFEKDLIQINAFCKLISPFLLTNPRQVLYDLQFNEKNK